MASAPPIPADPHDVPEDIPELPGEPETPPDQDPVAR